METKKEIISMTENFELCYDDAGEIVELDTAIKSSLLSTELKEAEFREKILDIIELNFYSLREVITEDLKDIWKRLDKLKNRIDRIDRIEQ